MNISHLQYFQVVAQEEHISRAAEKLHISQPSLSATIRRIEEELGTPLFDRKGRNIYLNENGQCLLKHVHSIFSQLDNLEKQMNAITFNLFHHFTMASSNSMFLDNWLTKFILNNEDARISQIVMSESQMITELNEEKIDVALGDFSDVPVGIAQQIMVPDEYMIIAPTHHPLAKKDALTFEDIRDEPFVALSSNINCRIADKMFAQKNATPNIIFEGSQPMMFDILSQGRGLLFVSKQMIYMRNVQSATSDASNIRTLEACFLPILDLKTTFNLSICWKQNRNLPAMAANIVQAFINDYPRFTADRSYCDNDTFTLTY